MADRNSEPDDWVDLPLVPKAQAAGEPDDWVDLPARELETSKLKTLMRGGAQGLSLGFADELTAGVGAVKDWSAGKLGLRGGIGIGDAYDSYIGGIRARDAKAADDNPLTFHGAELAGGAAAMAVAPGAMVPGRYVKLGKGIAGPLAKASKLKNAAKLGAGGVVAGAGLTEAPLDSPNFYEDALGGGALALGTAGVVKGGGAVLKTLAPANVAKKASNVILNTPEEITDLYIKDPKKVRNASRRIDVVKHFQDKVDELKTNVTEGSAESRAILEKEGQTFKGSQIRKVYKDLADAMEARAEGFTGDDPEREATIAWLRHMQKTFAPVAKPVPEGSRGRPVFVDRKLSTNRVKDSLQGLDRQTDWERAPGHFAKIDDTVKKGARHEVDTMLKERSPAYAEQMKGVARDTSLLSEAAPLAKNDKAMANVLRRLQTDQYGGGQVPKEVLERFDARMGTDVLERAKYAHAREAFDKSVTNGSRNVNLFSNMVKDVPIAKHFGPLIGGTVDKYGRKMTMSAVDLAADLEKTWQRDGIQKFLRDIEPIVAAARKGDTSALLTVQLLEQANPRAGAALRSHGGVQP